MKGAQCTICSVSLPLLYSIRFLACGSIVLATMLHVIVKQAEISAYFSQSQIFCFLLLITIDLLLHFGEMNTYRFQTKSLVKGCKIMRLSFVLFLCERYANLMLSQGKSIDISIFSNIYQCPAIRVRPTLSFCRIKGADKIYFHFKISSKVSKRRKPR